MGKTVDVQKLTDILAGATEYEFSGGGVTARSGTYTVDFHSMFNSATLSGSASIVFRDEDGSIVMKVGGNIPQKPKTDDVWDSAAQIAAAKEAYERRYGEFAFCLDMAEAAAGVAKHEHRTPDEVVRTIPFCKGYLRNAA